MESGTSFSVTLRPFEGKRERERESNLRPRADAGNMSVPPEPFSRYAAQAKVNTLLRDANGKNVELSPSLTRREGARPSRAGCLGRYYGREFEK